MATLLGNAYIRIRPDMTGFEQETKRSVSGAAKKAAKGAALAIGAAATYGAVKVIKDSITATSELNESLNAVSVTYGELTDGVNKLGKASAKSFGLSQTEFNQIAVRFSAFSKTIAGDGGDTVKVLEDLTTRGADFASVMDLEVNEALGLFQSGLAGETEPLRAYGIDLSAAAIEAHALATGIWDGTGAMTEAQKVQARYSSLMEQSNKTAGDFANTQGSMANQQRLLSASWTNFSAVLGEAFVPIIEKVLPKVNELLTDMTVHLEQNMPAIKEQMAEFGDKVNEGIDKVIENWPEIKQFLAETGDALKRVGDYAQAVYDAWAGLPPEAKSTIATLAMLQATGVVDVKLMVTPIISSAVGWLAAALLTGAAAPVTIPVAVVLAATLLSINWAWEADWFDDARQMFFNNESVFETMTSAWTELFEGGVWEGVKSIPGILGGAFAFIGPELGRMVGGFLAAPFTTGWEKVEPVLTEMGLSVGVTMQDMWIDTQAWWSRIGGTVSGWVDNVTTGVSTGWEMTKTATSTAWFEVTSTISGAWNTIKTNVAAAGIAVGITVINAWESVKTWTSNAWQSVKDTISTKWEEIKATVANAVMSVGVTLFNAWESVKLTVSNAWTSVKDTITNAMDGARENLGVALFKIQTLFTGAVGAIGRIWDRVTDVVKSPIRNMFQWINDNMIGPLNGVIGKFAPTLKIDPLVPTFHSGGYTGDQLRGREGLALLRNDEFVSDPVATARNREALEAGNKGARLGVLQTGAAQNKPLLEAINAAKHGFGIGGPSTEAQILGWLRSQGMSDAGIAGILGNIQAESGMRPGAVEGGNGEGHGLIQWSFSRKQDLFAFARNRGTSWTDLGTQLSFLASELTSYPTMWNGLLRATDPVAASRLFSNTFVRPGIYGERDNFASSFFRAMQSGSLTPSSGESLFDKVMGGAGSLVRGALEKVANPALDRLQDTFGGSWSADFVIGGMRKAVEAMLQWGDQQDSIAANAVGMLGYEGPGSGTWKRPVAGMVTSEFGPRWGSWHAGIDIGAPTGQPVFSAAAGKVMQSSTGWNGGYGNMVQLDHGGGWGSIYAHLSVASARVGEIVRDMQLIGRVGSTGDSTGPHLHFEVLRNGQKINPRSMVQFDQGGLLQPGWSAVYNGTGRPEAVFTDKQMKELTGGQVGGPTINIVNNYPQAEPTSVTTSRALRLAASVGGF